jgi:hypothetical protein
MHAPPVVTLSWIFQLAVCCLKLFVHVLNCPFEHMELILVMVHFSLYFLFSGVSLLRQMKDTDFEDTI